MNHWLRRGVLTFLSLGFLISCSDSTEPGEESSSSALSSSEHESSSTQTSSSSFMEASSSEQEASIPHGIPEPSDPHDINGRLGIGMNLGNHFESPTWGSWSQDYEESDFPQMAALGFQHVRIPVRWDNYTLEEEPFTIEQEALDSILAVVHDAKEAGLMVILNQHHHEPIYETPTEETPRFLAMWKQIAETFAGEGDYLLFELLNEPKDKIKNSTWHALFPQVIDVIRESNPNRTLVIGGVDWNSISGMTKLKIPETETNVIATFHYYDPFKFTHQGAEWVDGSDPWLGTEWKGKKSEQAAIRSQLEEAAQWGQDNNIPVYMGEFGAYSKADTTSRALWTEFVSAIALELDIPSSYWEWSAGYGVYNKKDASTIDYLENALLNHTIDWENWPIRPSLDTLPSFLIEDFEDVHTKTTIIGKLYADAQGANPDSSMSSWYVYHSDSSNWFNADGDSILTSHEVEAGGEENIQSILTTDGFAGKGFGATMHLWGQSYPYAGAGFNLNTSCDTCYLDFSDLQAIRFMAKGEGTIRVKLNTRFAEEAIGLENSWGAYEVILSLKEEWTEHILWADDFAPSPYSALEESKHSFFLANSEVQELEFMGPQLESPEADMRIQLHIDNIELFGVGAAELGLD